MALVRAYVHTGQFADAIPVLEAHLPHDEDGSLHVQLARAYTGTGQREKAAEFLKKSQDLQRASEERIAAAAKRKIEPPR